MRSQWVTLILALSLIVLTDRKLHINDRSVSSLIYMAKLIYVFMDAPEVLHEKRKC